MPQTTEFLHTAAEVATLSVSLEPAFNAITSLRLLTWPCCEQMSEQDLIGLDDWVIRVATAMTPEQLALHRLVFIGLYYIVDPDRSWPSFPAYVNHLESLPGEALRDQLLDRYFTIACRKGGFTPETLPDRAALLADADAYVAFLQRGFPGAIVVPELERQAHVLINDPPRLRRTIVDYLRQMWHDHLAAEWNRVRPMLQEAVEAFRRVDLSAMGKIAAAEYVIGAPLEDKLRRYIEEHTRVVFIPSPHIGPHQGTFSDGTTLWLAFGARLPAGMHSSSSALSRAELLVRLGALADETRLRILGLIAEEGELCAQDIITRLSLSQSAASRHLTQLSASGYLIERRQENAKCYRLNPNRIEDTLAALRQFLKL